MSDNKKGLAGLFGGMTKVEADQISLGEALLAVLVEKGIVTLDEVLSAREVLAKEKTRQMQEAVDKLFNQSGDVGDGV